MKHLLELVLPIMYVSVVDRTPDRWEIKTNVGVQEHTIRLTKQVRWHTMQIHVDLKSEQLINNRINLIHDSVKHELETT